MKSELEKLLSLIFSQGGALQFQGGKLLVGPSKVANLFRKEITRLKPEILIYFARCPVCVADLVAKVEELGTKIWIHRYCPETIWHYDKWER